MSREEFMRHASARGIPYFLRSRSELCSVVTVPAENMRPSSRARVSRSRVIYSFGGRLTDTAAARTARPT